MLATLTSPGSGAASTQTEYGRRARSIRRTTISCSDRSFADVRSCSPRWSSTEGSALRLRRPRQAHRVGARAAAPDEELGARAEERTLRRPAAEAEAARKELAERAVRAAGSCALGASTVTSRASTTLSSSPARIRSTAAATERSYPSGGDALAMRTEPVGCGSMRGSGPSRRAPTRAASAAETASRIGARVADGAQGQVRLARDAVEGELREDHQGGRERCPVRLAGALGVEREAAHPHRARARGEAGWLVHGAAARDVGAGRDHVLEPTRAA